MRMKNNNATFQIKLTRTPQGIFKTHKLTRMICDKYFFSNKTKLGRHQN